MLYDLVTKIKNLNLNNSNILGIVLIAANKRLNIIYKTKTERS